MRHVRQIMIAARVGALCGLCLFISGRVPAQEFNGEAQENGGFLYDPKSLASWMLRDCDLVADGEFFALPQYSPEELRSLAMEDVTVWFRPRKLYKGPPGGDLIAIRLNSDMLEFPGEGISRLEKRNRIIERQWKDNRPLFEQYRAAESAYEAGTMSEEAFYAKLAEVERLLVEREARDGLAERAGYRLGSHIHGKSFYQHGGAIRTGKSYFICLDRLPGGEDVYLLEDMSGTLDIAWGALRDHILSGFDDQEQMPAER